MEQIIHEAVWKLVVEVEVEVELVVLCV